MSIVNSIGPDLFTSSGSDPLPHTRLKFPKSVRLRRSSEFKHLYRNSKRHLGEAICVDFRQGLARNPRLGITVSKKFGKAHERNRFKRVVREAFRSLYPAFPEDIEINVLPRKTGIFLTKGEVVCELKSFLAKIQA